MTLDADAVDPAAARRVSRQDRQARVGILRNPNEPPRPPPRKAPLMGRWLSLRSGRRPAPVEVAKVELPEGALATQAAGGISPDLALRHDADGQLAGIDIATLMASVDGLGMQDPIRAPYAAELGPPIDALTRATAVPCDPSPSNLKRDPAAPSLPDPPDAMPESRPSRRSLRLRLVAAGMLITLAMLVLLPVAFAL